MMGLLHLPVMGWWKDPAGGNVIAAPALVDIAIGSCRSRKGGRRNLVTQQLPANPRVCPAEAAAPSHLHWVSSLQVDCRISSCPTCLDIGRACGNDFDKCSRKCINRENMKPCEGKHETQPHEQSFARCLCYGWATHGRGLVRKLSTHSLGGL